MTHPRNTAIAASRSQTKPRHHVVALRFWVATSLVALTTWANAEEITKSHGISTFGDLRYGPDQRLDYVNPDAPKGGEMAIWAGGTFDSLNPYSRKGRAGRLSSMMFESLLTATADEIGASYCFICETLEYPEDKSWVMFNLRDGVTFSDGSPLTVEDVEFSYDRMLTEGLVSFRAVLSQFVESVEVMGTDKIKYTFKPESPKRDRVGMVGGLPIFSKAHYIEEGLNLAESSLVPALGSAPYVLESYDINRRIVYRRDPDYWGSDLPMNIGRNNFDSIRVEYFGDSVAAFEGFKAGAYTFRNENSSIKWASDYVFPAVKSGDVVTDEVPDGSIATSQSFVMNLRREKFQDPKVREAIGLMFNFEWSNNTLFFGLYERITSFWHNTDLAATGAPSEAELAILKPLVDEGLLDASVLTEEAVLPSTSSDRQLDRKNLRKASALLDEAGWEIDDDGMRRKDGEILSIQFLEDSPSFDRIINPYVQNLRRLGIDAKLERVDNAQYTNRTRAFDFDMITDQFPMSFEPGTSLQQYFGSETSKESVFNSMGVSNPALDKVINFISNAKTKEDMQNGTRAMDRILRAERFWVPQWFKNKHTIAYYNMFEHPANLPPYSLGHLDFWWVNADKEAALKASGALK